MYMVLGSIWIESTETLHGYESRSATGLEQGGFVDRRYS